MKKSRIIRLATVALLFSSSAIAQQSSKEVIYIKSARFATPLVEKWASEYGKNNPGVEIRFADDQSSDKKIDINFVNSATDEETKSSGKTIFYTGRYALLPVANANSPILGELSKKGLNGKKLENLFFEKDIIEAASASSTKEKHEVTIYSGNKSDSFSGAFASHFGYLSSDIKGKKISGDDLFIIHAIQKDNSGITFNNLSYIFNIETRRLKDGLTLIPLDLKKEQREILLETDIDKTLDLLEKESIALIPVENIGFAYHENNLPAKRFLKWVLSEGQRYNHEFGFLKAEEAILLSQLKAIEELLLTTTR